VPAGLPAGLDGKARIAPRPCLFGADTGRDISKVSIQTISQQPGIMFIINSILPHELFCSRLPLMAPGLYVLTA